MAAALAPSTPVISTVRPFVDGIRVDWFRGPVTATASAPTAYRITRSSASGDDTVQIPASMYDGYGQYNDDSAQTAGPVSYTVTAVNSGGESAPTAPTGDVSRVPWPGPYEGARSVLVAVWDQASAVTDDLDSVEVDGPALQYPVNGSRAFGSDWRHSMDEVRVPDGTYDVGSGEGQLPLGVRAGTSCDNPTGSATVTRTAYALAGPASQSVDAELDCGNGHHLSLRFRWRTADPYGLPRLTGPAVAQAAPGASSTTTATVRNDGTAPVDVTSVQLVALPDGAPSGLAATGGTCIGAPLQPGATCDVAVAFTPAAGAVKESRALVALGTAQGVVEAGVAVGQLDGLGQPAPTGVSSPRGLRLTWSPPSSLATSVKSYRVEQLVGDDVTLVATVSAAQVAGSSWLRDLGGVATGDHRYRVVLETSDGRDMPSPWATVAVPESWLILGTSKGALPVNPDQGWSVGGTFGYASPSSSRFPMSMGFDPRRGSLLAVVGDGYGGYITRMTPTTNTGSTASSTYAPHMADVSPDGTRALVVRPRVTRGSEVVEPGGIFFLDAASSSMTEVATTAGLSSPRWLPDGSAFLAVADDGKSIVRVDLGTGARSTVLEDTGISGLAISRTGRISFVRADGWYDQDIVETTATGSGRRAIASYTYPGVLRYDPTGRYLFVGAHQYTQGEASHVYDLSSTTVRLVATLPLASDAAWWDPVSSAPQVTTNLPAWTTTTPSVALTATDPDDAVGGLPLRCRLDGGQWSPCSSTWRPGTLAPGAHTADVEATDPAGITSTTPLAWQVDGAAPSATLAALPTATLTSPLKLSWTATDTGGSGLNGYDLRYRRASPTSSFGSWSTAGTGLSTKSATLSVSRGYHYCVAVRARDTAGNVGAWTPERCTSVAGDDRSLTASRSWVRGTSTPALDKTVTRSVTSGAKLTRTGVTGRRIGIVATTCSTCGSVDVYLGSTRLGRVSLASSTTRYQQTRWLTQLTATRTGTLSIRTTSNRAVSIDGYLVAH
ncbi:hypothetical protein [Arthrobacter sp. NEB 688]|uniref:hypothetical protein n=1 Tax=Arthrobacter sp. NEB 688 TaxID=904039 RepID=UPI00156480A6|nr:hypothetical protein [Arthrobacter sp. NEB 688]QKE85088.1 hypothetical protein HL663_14865 [Arthrobacter sp. NEB 688]